MACNGNPIEQTCRTGEDDSEDEDASCFYRIITPAVIRDRKLVLPQPFFREYGDGLPAIVKLRVSSNGIWHVGIEKAGNVIWLHDGWQRFLEHYSIRAGYFLLFKYYGNSEFCVCIFDLTATEIEYPCSSNPKTSGCTAHASVSEQVKVYSDQRDHDTIEISDSSKAKSPDDSTMLPNDETGESKARETPTCEHTNGQKFFSSTTSQNRTCSNVNGLKRADEKKMRELHVARTFKSEHPFYASVMRKYNLSKSFILSVPAEFARTHLSRVHKSIELQDSDSQKWRITCVHSSGRVKSMSKGWTEFAKAKELCDGDVCVFELIQRTNVVLKVSIIRAKDT